MVDPVENPPAWYNFGTRPGVSLGNQAVLLRDIDGFNVLIRRYYDNGGTYLYWGCRSFNCEARAREHFDEGDVSVTSGEHRPHATRLIDWVKAICEYRGWAW